ncbi:MAG TPA: hypothetical protein VKU00_28785 [Chthonomonadaceae bacterium]|nr:hypothetical protein [Chthonomonadaceae bacterium]
MLHLLLQIGLGLLALLLGTILAVPVAYYAWWWKRELLVWRRSTEKRLEDKQAQQPVNPMWAVKLADLYQMRMYRSTGDTRQEQAAKSFTWYERAYRLTSAERRRSMLNNLARRAYDASVYDKAGVYATELLHSLPRQPNYGIGHAIHDGNLVLGRLALRGGDITKAKDYLLKSGQTPGGPGLNTGGPSMMLAKELLEQGESETVLRYFALCAEFWKMDYGKLKKWAQQVQQGQIPAFGKQLYR